MSNAATTLLVKDCTIFGANLFTPASSRFQPDAEPVFDVWAGFSKGQFDTVRAKIAEIAGIKDWRGNQSPLKDGDATSDDGSGPRYADYAHGKIVFAAKTKYPLGKALIIGPNRSPLQEAQVYPGVVAAVLVRPYAWTYSGKKGVSLGLSGVWVTGKGTRLEIGAGASATAEFEAAASSLQFDDLPTAEDLGFGA